jgi:hypothetical protein
MRVCVVDLLFWVALLWDLCVGCVSRVVVACVRCSLRSPRVCVGSGFLLIQSYNIPHNTRTLNRGRGAVQASCQCIQGRGFDVHCLFCLLNFASVDFQIMARRRHCVFTTS